MRAIGYALAPCCALMLSALCLAQCPTKACVTPAYTPAVTHAAPAYAGHAAPAQKVVLFADHPVYQPAYVVKDVFVFTGPPPAPLPGLVLGVSAEGREVRALAPGQAVPQQAQPAPQTRPQAPGSQPLSYEGERSAPAQKAAGTLAAELQASCAQCHAGGRSRGGFALGGERTDWKAVLEAAGGKPPRMPPSDSGKAPLSQGALAELKRLAGG